MSCAAMTCHWPSRRIQMSVQKDLIRCDCGKAPTIVSEPVAIAMSPKKRTCSTVVSLDVRFGPARTQPSIVGLS